MSILVALQGVVLMQIDLLAHLDHSPMQAPSAEHVFVIAIVLSLQGDFKPPKRGVFNRREAQVMGERFELR
jgi:hypothetical protein